MGVEFRLDPLIVTTFGRDPKVPRECYEHIILGGGSSHDSDTWLITMVIVNKSPK